MAKSQTELARGQARAMVILADAERRERLIEARAAEETQIMRAESQARLNSAQATAATLTAAVPWGVLSLLGCFGLGVVILGLALVVRRPIQTPPQIIERQIVYLPAPGQTRREVWQILSQAQMIDSRQLSDGKGEQG